MYKHLYNKLLFHKCLIKLFIQTGSEIDFSLSEFLEEVCNTPKIIDYLKHHS